MVLHSFIHVGGGEQESTTLSPSFFGSPPSDQKTNVTLKKDLLFVMGNFSWTNHQFCRGCVNFRVFSIHIEIPFCGNLMLCVWPPLPGCQWKSMKVRFDKSLGRLKICQNLSSWWWRPANASGEGCGLWHPWVMFTYPPGNDLEPQITIYKLLFQLDASKSFI